MDAPPYPGKLSLYFSNRHAVKPLTARWNDCAHPPKKDPCFFGWGHSWQEIGSRIARGASVTPAHVGARATAAEGLGGCAVAGGEQFAPLVPVVRFK